ncbi:MAG: ABC transporter substrate-binding protein [Planctomycetota bacterium]|jgi:branched-chain amino acid transport system substrate-binding protein
MARIAAALLPLLLGFLPWSCGSAEEDVIRLGAPLATAYLYGWAAERGIRLAVEEINAAGGVRVGGRKLRLEVDVMDTRDLEPGVPVDDAIKAVERLILQKEVDFLVGGPVRSEAALAVMDLMRRYRKVSIITTGVLSPAYHQAVAKNYDDYKYCFRITSDILTLGRDQMAVLEGIRKDHGLERVFIMVQDVAHARKAGEFMKKLFDERGFKVVGHEVYPTGCTDFAAGLLKSRKERAQLIFNWMDMPETAILLKQWRSFRLKSLPIGFMSAAEQPGFWDASGGSAEYTVVNLVNGGNAPASITPWTERFVQAYRKRWGLEPEGYGTSSSYMAVYALKDAVERAGTLEPDAVVKALESIDLMGVYGRIRFDPRSHQVIASTDPDEGAVGSVIQWQDGKRVTFWPAAAATGTLKLPPWMK